MVLQFGIVLPLLFVAFVGSLALSLFGRRWRGAHESWLAFGLAYATARA
jgi:hypothetical protein